MATGYGSNRNMGRNTMSKYSQTVYVISPGTPPRVGFLLHLGLRETWMFSYNTLKSIMTTKDMNVEL